MATATLLNPSEKEWITKLLGSARRRKMEADLAADMARLDEIQLTLKSVPERRAKQQADLAALDEEQARVDQLLQELLQLKEFVKPDEFEPARARLQSAFEAAVSQRTAVLAVRDGLDAQEKKLTLEMADIQQRLEQHTQPSLEPEPEPEPDPLEPDKIQLMQDLGTLRADVEYFKTRRANEYIQGEFVDVQGVKHELGCLSGQWWVLKCRAEALFETIPADYEQMFGKMFHQLTELKRVYAPDGYVKGLQFKTDMTPEQWQQYAAGTCRRAEEYRAKTDRPKPSSAPPPPPSLEEQAAELAEATEGQRLAIYGGMSNRQRDLVEWLSEHLRFRKVTWYESMEDKEEASKLEYSIKTNGVDFILFFTQWMSHRTSAQLYRVAKLKSLYILNCNSSGKQEVLGALAKALKAGTD